MFFFVVKTTSQLLPDALVTGCCGAKTQQSQQVVLYAVQDGWDATERHCSMASLPLSRSL